MITITKNSRRKQKIPKKVCIGPHLVTVKFVKAKVIQGAIALTKLETLEILINKEVSPALRYAGFFHEILEIINYLYELKLPHNIITKLETVLLAVSRASDENLIDKDSKE
jgi:hypothetical protein